MLKSLSGLLSRKLGKNPSGSDEYEEEIISMVNEGHEQGVIQESQAQMIQNIFDLTDKEAQDVMTHRRNITAIEGTMNLKDALAFMLDDTHSRFPVYLDNLDNIIGILFLKDAMRWHTRNPDYDNWQIKDIPSLLRKAVFIPETRDLSPLFKSMQTQKLQMVIVSDEYGQTAGLVAMEDILEEIVGNIQDEYDNDEPVIEKAGDDFLISGFAPLDEVSEALQLSLDDVEFETLNGFLISKLGRIPSDDDRSEIITDGYSFRILSVANKTIERVRAHRLPEEKKEEDEETK
ncbi:CBS domain protein [Marvinbryantia formatexigens DSM 14469]|uniref:CBS domain protein n=1 Tax=Marvinbryantia formatexigens DSM 14469 TaxID=478749 RepID=C6LCF2_9FIRM|nr:hemolysin family protein [Marvinbryantia formatexigens]EET61616.1 CBS domain protein [Marvinbryantia formatexigens DSM 14469]UWO24558.1 hemolysin family protein [Marvinbryantia formatexigens DSM 14469]SDF13156.1 putative hemolysin [Marvinbryantia formatexigens]